MGDDITIPAEVIRDDQGVTLLFPNGQRVRLDRPLPLAYGKHTLVVLTTTDRYKQNQQELAKSLLTEILNGTYS